MAVKKYHITHKGRDFNDDHKSTIIIQKLNLVISTKNGLLNDLTPKKSFQLQWIKLCVSSLHKFYTVVSSFVNKPRYIDKMTMQKWNKMNSFVLIGQVWKYSWPIPGRVQASHLPQQPDQGGEDLNLPLLVLTRSLGAGFRSIPGGFKVEDQGFNMLN